MKKVIDICWLIVAYASRSLHTTDNVLNVQLQLVSHVFKTTAV